MGIKETTPRRRAFRYEAADESTPVRAEFDEVTKVWSVTFGDLTYTLGKTPPWMVRELVVVHGSLYDKANPVAPKPRQLETLDCGEAEDGSVWRFRLPNSRDHQDGFVRFIDGTWCFSLNVGTLRIGAGVCMTGRQHPYFNSGPYTEVVE